MQGTMNVSHVARALFILASWKNWHTSWKKTGSVCCVVVHLPWLYVHRT